MKYRVRKRFTIMGVALLAIASSFIVYGCFFSSDSHAVYQGILERANPSLAMEKDTLYKASQRRQGVQKIIWYKKGAMRLEVVINSGLSDLVYEKIDNNPEIVEYMTDVDCLIQEEVFYLLGNGVKVFEIPKDTSEYVRMQTIRKVKADTAKYFYHSESLFAERVKMKVFSIPGHELPQSFEVYEPTMEASAGALEMTLVGGEIKLKIDKLKAEKLGHGKLF